MAKTENVKVERFNAEGEAQPEGTRKIDPNDPVQGNEKFMSNEDLAIIKANYSEQDNKKRDIRELDLLQTIKKQEIENLKLLASVKSNELDSIIREFESNKRALAVMMDRHGKFNAELKTKYDIKDEKWGFDPETGKIVEG